MSLGLLDMPDDFWDICVEALYPAPEDRPPARSHARLIQGFHLGGKRLGYKDNVSNF